MGKETESRACGRGKAANSRVLWLQGVTVAWMLVEAGVALYAARGAESVALLAFGSDSVVEVLSAIVVLLQFTSAVRIPERTASRAAGILLLVLAAVVAVIAVGALAMGWHAETSVAGMAITIAALAAMPVLAWLKRSEARRCGNAALAADAVQSATCAWLAFATLAGLVLNAAFHVPWVDSAAGLIAVPLLVKEGRSAWRGQGCGCP